MSGPWEQYAKAGNANAPWLDFAGSSDDDGSRSLPDGVAPSQAGAGRGTVSPRKQPDIPAASVGSLARDAASGVLQIGPMALKGVGDLARFTTGDRVGKGLSTSMEEGMQAIREVVGSERGLQQRKQFDQDMADPNVTVAEMLLNNKGALADQVLPTIGSMFVPVGAAGLAGKAASTGKAAAALGEAQLLARANAAREAGAIGATVAQNASDTYSTIRDKGGDQGSAYLGAAITAPVTFAAGKLTGGAAEAQAAKLLAGKAGAAERGLMAVPKSMLKEGAQETIEQAGQTIGEAEGLGKEIDPRAAAKELAVAGVLGTVMGGGVNAGGQLATPAGPLARAAAAAESVSSPAQDAPVSVEPVTAAGQAMSGTPDVSAMDAITQMEAQRDTAATENTGEHDASSQDQAPADAVGQPVPGEGGTQLSPVGDESAGADSAGGVAQSLEREAPTVQADPVAQPEAQVAPAGEGIASVGSGTEATGAPAAAAASKVFQTYEEADDYRKQQKQRGTTVQALPVEVDGGYSLAVKGSPEYAQAEVLRDTRRDAQDRAKAGILEGDGLNKLGKPYTIRLPALNAAKKAGAGFEAVPVQGGFVVRRTARPEQGSADVQNTAPGSQAQAEAASAPTPEAARRDAATQAAPVPAAGGAAVQTTGVVDENKVGRKDSAQLAQPGSVIDAAGIQAPATKEIPNGPQADQTQQAAPQAVGAQPAGPAAGVPAAGAGALEAAGVEGAIPAASPVVEVQDNYGRTHRVRQSDLYSNADRIPTVRKNGEVVAGEEIPRSIVKDAPSVAEPPPLDPLGWNAKKLASTYDMAQMNDLYRYVLRNYSNPVVGGGPVENGKATTERLNAEGRKIHAAMQQAVTTIYERTKAKRENGKSNQAVAPAIKAQAATETVAESAAAIHADPGQPAETATSAVVAQSMQKAASNEDVKPSAMRQWILGEIDKAMLDAPEKDATDFVAFDVPGDGTFKVQKSRERLQAFRKQVQASQGFKDGGQKQNTRPQEQVDTVRDGSGSTVAAIQGMLADGDTQAAVEYARAKGVEFESVGPQLKISPKGKTRSAPASVNSTPASVAEGLTALEREQLHGWMQAQEAEDDGQTDDAGQRTTPESGKAESTAKIEDFGEKIGGARKDRWKERGLNLDDLDSMTEAEGAELATKANVWKPDYEAMSEASEPVTAAMVKIIYDQLAAKPKKNTPEGRRQYVQMMRIVRDVLTEANGPEAARNAYLEIRKRAGLNTMDPKVKEAARGLLFSVYKGRSDPFVLGGADLMKAKKMVEDGFPAKAAPWKARLVVGRAEGGPGTTERGIEIYMERSAEVGTPLSREQILTGFYRVVTKDNKAVAFAPTKDDAEAAAATVYERDMKGKKDSKPEPVRPNLDELKRENLPQRIDRDVTAEDFVKDLGFRGIEFGNWSAQDERQRILNMAYDGLMDLAEIMVVPPKAMSLNGTLGMAFGARGGGRFAAHYEPGKLVINMTKIRGGGSMAHEWAHALDHYFGELDKADAYTTQARGASGWYSEDQYLGVPRKRMERVGNEWKSVEKMRLDNLRPEMAAAFDEVMRALFSKQITKAEMVRSHELDLERTEALARNEQQADLKSMYQNMAQNKRQALNELRNDPEGTMYAGRGRSEFANQAQALSGKATDGYWVRPTEMFARAFESWVFDRVTAMGARSDYLVHGVEEDRFAGGSYKGNPYPTGEERSLINAAFDKLAGTIKTKSTDQGVAMFSRSEDARTPDRKSSDARLVATKKLVDELKAKWVNAPPIEVVEGQNDPRLPKAVREDRAMQQSRGAKGVVRGVFYDGKVYLMADQLPTVGHAAVTLFHEVLGHYGLQGVFGERLNPILDQIAALRRREMAEKAQEYKLDLNNPQERRMAAEEVLAEMAQSRPEMGYVRRAVAVIRGWLRTNVPGFGKMRMTDEDIIGQYLLPARGWVERGGHAKKRGRAAAREGFQPAFSLEQDAGKKALAEFAKADELFALPKSDKKTMAGILGDLAPGAGIKSARLGLETMYTIRLPGADGLVYITERETSPHGAQRYSAELVDGEVRNETTVRPGENPEDVDPDVGDVWLDVSRLKPGEEGALAYALAANYAHNTGRIFIGDPAGLSAIALRRRLEQMISSALKFGTTAHLAPHPDQVRGGHGVPPLRWVYGDDVGNVERMIAASVKALDNAFPQSKQIEYRDGDFYNTKTRRKLPRGVLAVGLGESIAKRRGVLGAEGSSAQAGWRTIARAALFRHLQSTIAPVDGGVQERGSLLARAGANVPRLHSDGTAGQVGSNEERKTRIFYSRAATASDADTRLSGLGEAIATSADKAHAKTTAELDKAHASRAKSDATKFRKKRDFIQEQYEADADKAARDAALALVRGEEQYAARTNDAARADGIRLADARRDAAKTSAEAAPSQWESVAPTATDKVIYELQDGRVDLKRTQEAIKAAGNQIDERFDARLAETLHAGRVAKRTQTFLEKEALPLLRVMARMRVSQVELGDYLHARAAPERNAQIAKVNPDMPDGGAGANSQGLVLTTAAAEKYIADLPTERRSQLEQLAERVDAMTKGTRALLVDEGLEKADTIAAWEAAYSTYVPMFREDVEFSRITVSKRATGSEKEAVDILAHVLMQREAAIGKAESNRVKVALYGLALSNPNPTFWATIRPGQQAEAIAADLERMGVDPLVAEAGMQGIPSVRTVDPVTNQVVDRINPMYRSLPGAITLKVNGENRVLMLNEKDPRALRLAESLKGQDGLTNFDLSSTMVGKTTRWLAAVNTQYNPVFGVVNFIRDTLGGAINLTSTVLRGNSMRVLGQVPAAIAGIGRSLAGGKPTEWSRLFEQFQDDGGQTGYRDMFKDGGERAAAVEAQLKRLAKSGRLTPINGARAALGLLDGFNTSMENAVRLSAYKVALDKGVSRPEAARLARELTVDFNRKGRTGRELGPLYAFFNASLQGTERTLQTLKGPDGGKIIAGGLALGMMNALMLAMAGYDDDELQGFTKARALIIPLGSKDNGYVAIPLPLGLHVLPNTGRVITELVIGDRKNAGKKAFDAIGEIAGAFNPMGGGDVTTMDGALRTVAPTVVDPLIELGFNKNFAGSTIEKEPFGGEKDNRPGASRAKESTLRTTTGQAYLGISKALNTLTGGSDYKAGALSPTPERVRYIAQTAGGGVLRELEKIINTSTAAARREDVKVSQIPLASRFFGKVDADQVEKSRYFDSVKSLERLEGGVKAAQKAGDMAAVERLLHDHPEAAMIGAGNKAQQAIQKLNKLAVTTVDDQDTMRQIDAARIEQMKALNEAIRDMEMSARGPTLAQRMQRPRPKDIALAQ